LATQPFRLVCLSPSHSRSGPLMEIAADYVRHEDRVPKYVKDQQDGFREAGTGAGGQRLLPGRIVNSPQAAHHQQSAAQPLQVSERNV
jgi:hypothetical protein